MAKVKMKQQVWNTLRIAKFCKLEDFKISCTSDINIESVRHYLRFLERAGYVVNLRNNVYMLVKNTGRKAPTKVVKDENEGEMLSASKAETFKLQETIEFLKSVDSFTSYDLEKFTTRISARNLISRLKIKGLVKNIGLDGKYKIYKYIGE